MNQTPGTVVDHVKERAGVARISTWMSNIIEQFQMDIGIPSSDAVGDDQKSPDIVIRKTRRSTKTFCLVEAKLPQYNIWDESLKEIARQKAVKRQAPFFCVTNFRTLLWFDTEKVNAAAPLEEQLCARTNLSDIRDLDELELAKYSTPIKRELEAFLRKLASIASGHDQRPRIAVDELLIIRLHDSIKTLSGYYKTIIEDRCKQDPPFAKDLKKWFINQQWTFAWQTQDYDKAARQAAYLLVNKILFYNVLQGKRPSELDPLEIPRSLTKGDALQKHLQIYFEQVLKIDYETVFSADFIDDVAFPNAPEVVEEIKEFVNILQRYNFATFGYDIIGRIFERLIPRDERHYLGQYFTNADVVDLILRFCVHHENDNVFDPSCGAGTFLVRAYQHKKMLNQRKDHESILATLWGNDIAKFPAHLATINLAINDLSIDKNYPNIMHKDFFLLQASDAGFNNDNWRKQRAITLGVAEKEVHYPAWFDAIVGNPPYTRQEEIPDTGADKGNVIGQALEFNGSKVNISDRAGIHAYFFVHGAKFLKEGGYFGFIVSNSWLDADFGRGLQEFLLKYFKIIAVLDSKVERWFEEAGINTCIVILQKCGNEEDRTKNIARFVYLKKYLREIIPPAQDEWERRKDRLDAIDEIIKTITAHNSIYENDDMRIVPIVQERLWNEGLDPEKEKYIGNKWGGKYLRSPDIYWTILEKGKDKLARMGSVAEVRRGFTTGANEFFYLDNAKIKTWGIREKYLRPLIKSPRESKKILIDPAHLKFKIFMCDKNKRDIKGKPEYDYIKWGEQQGFHNRPSCASRNKWWDIGERRCAPIISPCSISELLRTFMNPGVLADKRLYEIYPHEESNINPILISTNSILGSLFMELGTRTGLGEGLIDFTVYELADCPIVLLQNTEEINSLLNTIKHKEILPLREEIAHPARHTIDNVVFDAIGLTRGERDAVYEAVLNLVESRLRKAESTGKQRRIEDGLDVDAFIDIVLEKVGDTHLGSFYHKQILNLSPRLKMSLPEYSNSIKLVQSLFAWELYSGKKKIICHSEEEGRYLKTFLDIGLSEVDMPKDNIYLAKIIKDLEIIKTNNQEVINSYLESILPLRTREQLWLKIWAKLMS